MKLRKKMLTRNVGIIEMNSNYADHVWGIFKGEGKFRFHCTVEINGKEELCYLPSNCKLCKCQYKNAQKVENKNVQFSNFYSSACASI